MRRNMAPAPRPPTLHFSFGNIRRLIRLNPILLFDNHVWLQPGFGLEQISGLRLSRRLPDKTCRIGDPDRRSSI